LLDRIDDAMTEAARLSGDWLVCKRGCTQCCMGPFGITQLDALRLRKGLAELQASEPTRAVAVRERAAVYAGSIAPLYPGDTNTGDLFDEDALPESMADVPCPALDPATGCCDLYEHRPVTCHAFGPVTRIGDGAFGACELCYEGATEEQMAACAVDVDPDRLEQQLLNELEAAGVSGMTIVAFAVKE
jgi:Fe-S-cluster containining protein